MDDDWISESERLQIEQIRALEMEELQVEEADDDSEDSSIDSCGDFGDEGASSDGVITFNTCLPLFHRYLGEIEDTHGRVTFLDGGAVLNLPMLYLEGVVLFPEAILPLKVIQRSFRASVERAMKQEDAPYTIGVVRVYNRSRGNRLCCSKIGTTAEIRQYKQLEDGSLNVITRGQQRFYLRRTGIDIEGAPCAEVEIIQEEKPLRIPKDAFGELASIGNTRRNSFSRHMMVQDGASFAKRFKSEEDDRSDYMSDRSAGSNNSTAHSGACYSSKDASDEHRSDNELSSEYELLSKSEHMKSCSLNRMHGDRKSGMSPDEAHLKIKSSSTGWAADESRWLHRAPRAFWSHWVYRMYDSYSLARRAADMWKEIVGVSNLDDLIRKPDLLSFYIGSKIPASESTRQELLEIHGISYRLRREIQLLERFDLVRCKACLSVIAKRSDLVVMSRDGPLNAFANPHGYVHEVLTLYNATGLALLGSPVKEHSWFPGYAWTITNCATCETNMGWLFTATKRSLRPKSFWGIRCSQVAEEIL